MVKKIKILYTIPNFDTAGSGKVVYDLVRNLDKNVFSPDIIQFLEWQSQASFKGLYLKYLKMNKIMFDTSRHW